MTSLPKKILRRPKKSIHAEIPETELKCDQVSIERLPFFSTATKGWIKGRLCAPKYDKRRRWE